METASPTWSKTELQVYILLLCARADNVESPKEIELIKSKVDASLFEKVYAEFTGDTLDNSLQKIQNNISYHEYSFMELTELRSEMHEVFNSDKKFSRLEHKLDKILDNIIY
ncbi:MAG: hypothetical protein CL868_12940 [Cytophagaceae bacterium]|nr:hypothetical protein [Cytophagaceae bacterium]|tara:strand:- start:3668 stop:4003 length:336 start_codon:yes stop_codon:yes gene_type:complete